MLLLHSASLIRVSSQSLASVKLSGGVKTAETPQQTGGFWGIIGSAASKVSNLSAALGTAEVRFIISDALAGPLPQPGTNTSNLGDRQVVRVAHQVHQRSRVPVRLRSSRCECSFAQARRYGLLTSSSGSTFIPEMELVCAELAGACANVASAESSVDKVPSLRSVVL